MVMSGGPITDDSRNNSNDNNDSNNGPWKSPKVLELLDKVDIDINNQKLEFTILSDTAFVSQQGLMLRKVLKEGKGIQRRTHVRYFSIRKEDLETLFDALTMAFPEECGAYVARTGKIISQIHKVVQEEAQKN